MHPGLSDPNNRQILLPMTICSIIYLMMLLITLPINAVINSLFQHPGAVPLRMHAVHHILGICEQIDSGSQLRFLVSLEPSISRTTSGFHAKLYFLRFTMVNPQVMLSPTQAILFISTLIFLNQFVPRDIPDDKP